MTERIGTVTMEGTPLTLIGNKIKVGDQAPDFTVIDNDLSPINLSYFLEKPCIIASVPSLDTPVCDLETQRFNEEAGRLNSDITILTISMDLPFAQKRWCGATGVRRVQTFSDHKDASFGIAYGVLIKELRLLARTVFVIDAKGIITYRQLVKEITEQPDYDAILDAAKKIF